MKLGIVTTSYPRDANDFAGSFVATRVLGKAQLGWEVSIVAAGVDTGSPGEFRIGSPLFGGEGAPERLGSMGRVQAGFCSIRFTLQQAAAVRAQLANCDAIESHWLVPSALAVALAFADTPRKDRPKHHVVVHSGDVSLLENLPLGSALTRRILREVDSLQVVSGSLHQRMLVLCGRGFQLPPVQVAAMKPSAVFNSQKAELPRSRFVLGVGRLVPIKGFEDLLFSVARMARSNRPAVVLLGDGPLRDRLAWLARRLSVDLTMPGFVPPDEVARYLAQTMALVVPSRTLADGRCEGAPLVVQEALALGVSLVVSASAAEGVLPGPSVQVFKEGDHQGLTSALGGLLHACATPVAPAKFTAHLFARA
jgi:glycosyltransferase involved in cell wall biosynthesis